MAQQVPGLARLYFSILSWTRTSGCPGPILTQLAAQIHPPQPSHFSLHSHPKTSIALWGLGSAEPHLSFAGALLVPLGLL